MGSAGVSGAAAEKMGKGRLAACKRTMARSIAGACELDHASTLRAHQECHALALAGDASEDA
jgi:hypothetical protein